MFGYGDTTLHEAAVERLLEIAEKKSVKDYRYPEGSTLVFVCDKTSRFWDDNEAHREILDDLADKLGVIKQSTDEVELLLLLGDNAEIRLVSSRNL